jgi:hypothetical protein
VKWRGGGKRRKRRRKRKEEEEGEEKEAPSTQKSHESKPVGCEERISNCFCCRMRDYESWKS